MRTITLITLFLIALSGHGQTDTLRIGNFIYFPNTSYTNKVQDTVNYDTIAFQMMIRNDYIHGEGKAYVDTTGCYTRDYVEWLEVLVFVMNKQTKTFINDSEIEP